MAPRPCAPWCEPTDVRGIDDVSDDALLPFIETASWVLYQLSGRRYAGECETTIRPCASGPPSPPETSGEWPAIQSGVWSMATQFPFAPAVWDAVGACGCRGDRCGCGAGAPTLRLPGGPVTAVTEVRIDGEVLGAGGYRLDDDRKLVRLANADGTNAGWPCCQRMDLPDSEPGTWAVTYTHGRTPPRAGLDAAAALAAELYRKATPRLAGECRLPDRLTQVTRQNVTMIAFDPVTFFREGLTGITEVDLFLVAANKGSKRSGSVLSPDVFPAGRRVGS